MTALGAPARAYDLEMAKWRNDPKSYWSEAARGIDWIVAPQAAFRLLPDGRADWFPGGVLNTCANVLDRHVAAGRGDHPALIWDSPASGETAKLSYAELLRRVAGFAGGLRALGVTKGDRVLISMPPVPETVIAMLATARLGAVHVVVFAGFAAPELAARIDDTAPRVIITASASYVGRRAVPLLPVLAAALELAGHRPAACVVLNRGPHPAGLGPDQTHDFHALELAPPAAPVPVAAADPLYILHTSGTTGRPKGVVRDNGGHAVAIRHSMAMIYGVGPDDVFCTTADPGWVVGHSYAVYGPLLAGCTTVLFEGSAVGTPDAAALWRLCATHRIAVLFTSPSALRAARQEDNEGSLARAHDLSALRRIFVAGERSDPATLAWAQQSAGVPVLDHWWQTETGWAVAGRFAGLAGAADGPDGFGWPTPGFDLRVLDESGREVPPGMEGELVLRLPLPPGCLTGLWGEATLAQGAYFARFPGYYRTHDLGVVEVSGGVRVISRCDDVLKVAGRRIAGGTIEDALALHPDVAECAVVGVPDRLRGEVPVAFVVLTRAAADVPSLRADLVRLVRERIGRFTGLRKIHVVAKLPRTKSGKIVRRALLA